MTVTTTIAIVTPETLLEHWQGHRRLTRRVIETFPEDKLFTFSVGGMRPFSELVLEFLKMAEPIARGVATGEWKSLESPPVPRTKDGLLKAWDESTSELNQIWASIPLERFRVTENAFGMWKNENINTILYAIDN